MVDLTQKNTTWQTDTQRENKRAHTTPQHKYKTAGPTTHEQKNFAQQGLYLLKPYNLLTASHLPNLRLKKSTHNSYS